MDKPATPIVIIAFNRPNSLVRLLESLSRATYNMDNVPLIISIDKSDSNEKVLKIANNYNWPFGEKEVIYAEKNLGLRKHDLKCAGYAMQYGSVILLEDDLYVAPSFYSYTVQALKFCEGKSYIGGISLYNHMFNVHKREAFSPLDDGFDNWYFQFASSWGQAWTKEQFESFKNWYDLNQGELNFESIPKYVLSWSNKSWLKYFITYLVVSDRYFIYPKLSLTTNFGDAGTHVESGSTTFQVPLASEGNKIYNFSGIDESQSVYDSFFENSKLHTLLDLPKQKLLVDLYGYRNNFNKKYLLTSQILDYRIIKTFGRSFRPHDYNIIANHQGNAFFLYDTTEIINNQLTKDRSREIYYNIKDIYPYDAWYLVKKMFKNKIVRILKKSTSVFKGK